MSMNNNCDLTIGPCACGAWHTKEDLVKIIDSLKKLLLLFPEKLEYPKLPKLD